MKNPPIVSAQEWDAARQELLVEEKRLTRARDALAARRRRMPWMAVEKEYRFDGPDGPVSLLDLFEGRRQLIVYRAFYAPDVTTYPQGGGAYPERACVGCSFLADQVAHPAHLNARDTTLAFVSRAPQAEIQGLKERMGWQLIGITPGFDQEVIRPGHVKRVYEAIYAKVLVSAEQLLHPRATDLTPAVKALFDLLYPGWCLEQ